MQKVSPMEFGQDLVKGSIVPIVLALLDERPMYGYEIVKVVNARSGGRLEWKEGTLYPTLHRLESASLLRSYWADAGDAGPAAEVLRHYGQGPGRVGPTGGRVAGVLGRRQLNRAGGPTMSVTDVAMAA